MSNTTTKKFLRLFSKIILILTFLSIYGWSVKHISTNGKKFGPFTKPFKAFISFPGTVVKVFKSNEIKGIPPSYIERNDQMKETNQLTYDLFGLNSFFNIEKNIWEIKLHNFRNDSVIHTWIFTKEMISLKNVPFNSIEINNCLLLPDTSIILFCDATKNLYKLDKNSKVIWHNTTKKFHHSLNLSSDSNLWICSTSPRGFLVNIKGFIVKSRKNKAYFNDDFITKVDLKTGKILFDKSISDILIENGYQNFVYGFTNERIETQRSDPIHLNDIEPALRKGDFWKKGDLFLSLRHRSLIILYRPSTNKIIRLLYGPFLNQHDIDIISDNEISIFNNNTTDIGKNITVSNDVPIINEFADQFNYSQILIYNFKKDSYRNHCKQQFINENIYTHTEGLHKFLSNGDVFVECENDGRIYILNNDEIKLKKQFKSSLENLVHLPSWTRIYENLNQ